MQIYVEKSKNLSSRRPNAHHDGLTGKPVLMFSIFIGNSTLDIYDAFSGKLLRSVDEIGFTPTLLQTP